jgi:hypothetical protein
MNAPKCDALDYIQFLIAAQKVFTCTEAARCAPTTSHPPAHDAFTRLLQRQPSNTTALWREVRGLIERRDGVLVLDDTTLDKPYAQPQGLVTYHWSGKHHRVVKGINLLTLLWTDGARRLPCDFRVYDKPAGGETKNAHFQQMLAVAKRRGLSPTTVLFDGWYASLKNLKQLRTLRWAFLTRLKVNRLVTLERGSGAVPIAHVAIPAEGRVVHLRGYGFVKVFRLVAPDGDTAHWVTNDQQMTEAQRAALALQGWEIESYHRGLKQCCGVERAQVRTTLAMRGHLLLAIRAFVRLEVHRWRTGLSWYAAKMAIVREAIRAYLAHPRYVLRATA